MNLANRTIFSITNLNGLVYGKQYIVKEDNGREITLENGNRFFREHVEIHFVFSLQQLQEKSKKLIQSLTTQNHKSFASVKTKEIEIEGLMKGIGINQSEIKKLEIFL